MQFVIIKEQLQKALQHVAGVVERRQTLPILSNVLITVTSEGLSLTGTDLEVELISYAETISFTDIGMTTLPARKLLDICRALPDSAEMKFILENEKVTIKSGRSRFSLSTLDPKDFPNVEDKPGQFEFQGAQQVLKALFEKTSFSMAQQDVRYYLNGLLFEVSQDIIRAVATDGHRLATAINTVPSLRDNKSKAQVIIPRKGVLELIRLLGSDEEQQITMTLSDNHIRVVTDDVTMTSKLIDGRFPDYKKVIPKRGDKIIEIQRDEFKRLLSRVAILSNEKYRGIRLRLGTNVLKASANNPEQEEAEEEMEVAYSGADFEIGFNVSYMIDILGAMDAETIVISFSDPNSSVLLETTGDNQTVYVIMPMRL